MNPRDLVMSGVYIYKNQEELMYQGLKKAFTDSYKWITSYRFAGLEGKEILLQKKDLVNLKPTQTTLKGDN